MSKMSGKQEESEHPAVTLFREYLRIKTVHPNPDYDGAIEFLKRQSKDLGLSYQVLNLLEGKPILVMTLEGSETALPSILLNSHMDVVPVELEYWTYDPFAAVKDDNGNIYGRGAQDMKCLSIIYLEALRRLKERRKFRRTIHLSFVPDEEIGGAGMQALIASDYWKRMNVGFALDEGGIDQIKEYQVTYGERFQWGIKVKCVGETGHGSKFIQNTAAEKLQKVINSFLEFREEQRMLLQNNPNLTIGEVTTVNLTMIEGGFQLNVIPTVMTAVFDVRVTPTADSEELEKNIARWCHQAGENVTYEFLMKLTTRNLTPITKDNPWWNAFSSTCEKMKLKVKPLICFGRTDSSFLREKGIPALGFSPFMKDTTPPLCHDHNEYLNEAELLRGVDIYCEIVSELADVPAFPK